MSYSLSYTPSTYYASRELLSVLVKGAGAWLVLLLVLLVVVAAMLSSVAMHLFFII
jgi:hypothetical protein